MFICAIGCLCRYMGHWLRGSSQSGLDDGWLNILAGQPGAANERYAAEATHGSLAVRHYCQSLTDPSGSNTPSPWNFRNSEWALGELRLTAACGYMLGKQGQSTRMRP